MSTATPIIYFLHLMLSGALFWSCFCRQAKSCNKTREDIRVVFWILQVAALFTGLAPYANYIWPELFDPYVPAWIDVFLLGSITLVQYITQKHWNTGVPAEFRITELP